MNNILNTYPLNRYMWYLLHHFPTPQYFLHLSRPRDQFVYGGKTINVSFEFKGKDTFFVRECLRQKGLKNLFEMFKS